jgi:tetratricopeptide (TPR) repeat protein
MTSEHAGEAFGASDLRLEFRAPALLYNDASADVFTLISRAQDQPLAGLSPQGSAYEAMLDESEESREAALHARQMAVAMAARDYDGAIREGEQGVASSLHDERLKNTLARAYIKRAAVRYRRRDLGGAADDLRSALELAPAPTEQFRARLLLGDFALARNDMPTAARQYGGALEIARETGARAPELHVRMSQVLRSLGDLPHAIAELDRAARECENPRRVEEIVNLRRALQPR